MSSSIRTFKEYVNNRPVLNVDEIIFIDGIGEVKAKVDSGNEAYNVLHGVNVSINGNTVTFTTVNDKQLDAPLSETIIIHIGSGVKEERPVVLLNIKVKNESYSDIPFSIADRTENEEPVLIGEPFIKKINALIDVNAAA